MGVLYRRVRAIFKVATDGYIGLVADPVEK